MGKMRHRTSGNQDMYKTTHVTTKQNLRK